MKINKQEIEKRVDNKIITKRKHPTEELFIYNYSPKCQFDKLWDEYTMMCRGLILDNEGNIVARPFKKFFNYGEIEDQKLPNGNFRVYDKMDGCCDKDTILITEKGKQTIKNICDNNYKGKILSYNIYKNEFEFDYIISHSIQKNNNNWYEIKLDNGSTLKLTANHKIWLPKLQCYRKVEDLIGNEELLLKI